MGESGIDASGRVLKVKLVKVGRVPGIRGQALSFSGSGSYFDYGDSPRLSFNAKATFTMAFWVQTRGCAGADRSVGAGPLRINLPIFESNAVPFFAVDGRVLGE